MPVDTLMLLRLSNKTQVWSRNKIHWSRINKHTSPQYNTLVVFCKQIWAKNKCCRDTEMHQYVPTLQKEHLRCWRNSWDQSLTQSHCKDYISSTLQMFAEHIISDINKILWKIGNLNTLLEELSYQPELLRGEQSIWEWEMFDLNFLFIFSP